MPDNNTSTVLGKIDAINTVIENFPSSILDLLHGPRYDNVVDFLIDVLNACGVDIREIIREFLSDIFDIKDQMVSGITGLYDSIENLEIDENGKFFTGLEYSVKGILMALLSSIFSCSAIPILPNKYFDTGKDDPKFTEAMRAAIAAMSKLRFPIEAIDPFGYLSYNPLSKEGRLYYKIEGKDVCYEKKCETFTITYDIGSDAPHCLTNTPIYFKFGNNHSKYVSETEYGSPVDNHEIEDELYLHVDKKLEEDLSIEIKYTDKYNVWGTKKLTIKKGDQDSEVFNLTPSFGRTPQPGATTAERDCFMGIKLSSGGFSGECAVCVGKTHVYVSKTLSRDVVNFWLQRSNAAFSCNLREDSAILGDDTLYNCPMEHHDEEITTSGFSYYYEPCDFNDNAEYYNDVPESATSTDSDFIIVHQGLTNATLNRTYDMNAFLWYTMNKRYSEFQFEYNKTMWDSRITAKKKGIERVSAGKWNEWYNSKTEPNEELSCQSLNDTNKALFPILQCYRDPFFTNELVVEFPAQRFFKPRAKETDTNFVYSTMRLNSTLYEYNWVYLNNIQIFKPKIILYGMLNALLNGILYLKNGLSFNFKQTEMRAKLSESIKKYITAVDTNVEDCYFDFSNDEFDAMIEDMLLSRYNAMVQHSETPTIKELSIEDYVSSIDNINFGATQDGGVTQIMKTVTDVSLKSPGNYQSVDYGIELGFDTSWWKEVVIALAMPIIESLFTPQVILLIMINFDIMGVVNKESLFSNKNNEIVNLLINKIFGLVKSIIRFLMDKFKELLLRLVFKYLIPKITMYELLLLLEKLDAWIKLLKDLATCVPMFNFSIKKAIGQIDNVQYADIITQQSLPEADSNC